MANISKVLSDVFFGTQQSRYAAVAIFLTIAILCFFILFTSSDIPIDQRLVVVFFILIASVPSILFSLFELTCIVTGGTKTSRWWCYWLAWFISILIIVYCVFIIISVFLSMASYDTAMSRINEEDVEDRVSSSEANEYAKNVISQYEEDKNSQKVAVPVSEPVKKQPERIVQEEVVTPVMVSAQPRSKPQINLSQNPLSGFDNNNFAPISNVSDSSAQYPISRPSYNNPTYPKSSTLPEPFTNLGNGNNLDYYPL